MGNNDLRLFKLYAAVGSAGAKLVSKKEASFYPDHEQPYMLRYLFDDNGEETGLALTDVDEGVTDLTVPEGVTEIGSNAIHETVQTVVLPQSLRRIGYRAFSGFTGRTVSLPAQLKEIAFYAFADSGITEIVLPEGITTLEDHVFWGCENLETVVLPDGMTALNEGAFQDCASLKQIDLPDGITTLGGWVFNGCTSLTRIDLPESLQSVGENAFTGSGLREVGIPDSWTSFAPSWFPEGTRFIISRTLEEFAKAQGLEYSIRPFVPDALMLPAEGIRLEYGRSAAIPLQIIPDMDWKQFSEPEFIFFSDDPQIAYINSSGLIKGMKPGKTTVYVQDRQDDFINASMPVTVVDTTIAAMMAFVNLTITDRTTMAVDYGVQGCVFPCQLSLNVYLNGNPVYTEVLTDQTSDYNRIDLQYTRGVLPPNCEFLYTVRLDVTDAEGNTESAVATYQCSYETSTYTEGVGTPVVMYVHDENGAGYRYMYTDYVTRTKSEWTTRIYSDDPTAVKIKSIQLDERLMVHPGETKEVASYQLSEAARNRLVWFSDAPEIVDVDETGYVTGIAIGTATITAHATDGSGAIGTCTVYCCSAVVESITVSAEAIDETTQTQRLSAAVLPENATFPNVIWSSSDETVATVDATSLVTWLDAGTVEITAEAEDGFGVTGKIALTWQGILIREITLLRDPQDPLHLVWRVTPENATNPNMVFSSNRPNLVSVDSAGYMTYLAEGTATIRARAVDGSNVAATIEIIAHFEHPAEQYPQQTATCTEPGYAGGTRCALCGLVLEEPVVTPALGHDWGETVYTWTQDGSQVTARRVCARDAEHVETETVLAE